MSEPSKHSFSMDQKLNELELSFLREFATELTGCIFEVEKNYVFENRLPSMAKAFDFDGIKSLTAYLRNHAKLLPIDKKNYFVDLVTTHETSFFRDKSPFKVLKTRIMEEYLSSITTTSPLSIYSAACSTGQEPVSIAMTIFESLPDPQRQCFNIDATDISRFALDKAKSGNYSQLEVQRGLPIKLLTKYFRESESQWNLDAKILRNIVTIQVI